MKRTFLFALAVGLTLFYPGLTKAQDFSKADQVFDSLDFHDKYMGTVMIAKNGEKVYSRSIGFADFEKGQKLNENTKFRIGSISKIFTSVLIMKAVEEGKLQLDQKLSDFYSQIPNADKITVDMLLNHRSGIHNFTDDENYLGYSTEPKSEEEMIAIIQKGGSDFEPNSKASYSNSNYILLTFILEKTYESSYGELLAKKVSQPLGLENTEVFESVYVSQNEAKSYAYNGTWKVENETHPSIPLGAGAISSTVSDLIVFIQGLFDGKLISESSLAKMMEIKEGYGRGMFTFPYFDRKAYGHTGGIDGFRSLLGYFPDDQVAIVTLSNGLNWNANEVTLTLLNANYGNEVKIPSFQTYALNPSDLDLYVGEYVTTQIPINFTFVKDGDTLVAKPSGQPDTRLEPIGKHQFEFSAVGAVFIFDPEKGELTFKQGGGTFSYKKK